MNLQARVGGGPSHFVIDSKRREKPVHGYQLNDLHNMALDAESDGKISSFVALIAGIVGMCPGLGAGVSLANNAISALASDTSRHKYCYDTFKALSGASTKIVARGIDMSKYDVLFSQEVVKYEDDADNWCFSGGLKFERFVKREQA